MAVGVVGPAIAAARRRLEAVGGRLRESTQEGAVGRDGVVGDEELLLRVAESEGRGGFGLPESTGALKVDWAGKDCWACISEAVPAIRKLNAAMRHAIPKKLRLVFIFW